MRTLSGLELDEVILKDSLTRSGLSKRTEALDPVYYFPLDVLSLDLSVELQVSGINEENRSEGMLIAPKLFGWVTACQMTTRNRLNDN
jgi:hypothetical protein